MRSSMIRSVSLLLFLLAACSSLSCMVQGKKLKLNIMENRDSAATGLMESAFVAYSVERPDLDLQTQTAKIDQLIQNVYGSPATADFMVTGQRPGDVYNAASIGLIHANPDITSFPVAVTGIVPLYNLPEMTSPLLLNGALLAKIMMGDITNWADAQLKALNPTAPLPNKTITIVINLLPTPQTLAFTQALAKFDPTFVTRVGKPSDFMNWPTSRYGNYIQLKGTHSSTVVATPYTFSYGLISSAVAETAQLANMVNKAGQVVVGNTDSLTHAFLEQGVTINANGAYTWNQDLSDGSGYEAWPMAFTIACYMPLTAVRTTCAAKAEVVNFWLWFFGSPVVDSIMSSLSINRLPPISYTNLDLDTFLRERIQCDSTALSSIAINAVTMSGIPLNTLNSDLITSNFGFYGSIVNTNTFSYVKTPELKIVQQLAARETDAGMLIPLQSELLYGAESLQEQIWDPTTTTSQDQSSAQGDLMFFPFAMYSVIPTVNLPASVQSAYGASNFPLVLDMQTLGSIFAGKIGTWTDPNIEDLNPGLTAAFANTSVSINITLVICCKAGVQMPITNAFVMALNRSSTDFMQANSWSLPVDWTLVQQAAMASGVTVVHVDTEQQMESAITRIPGAIGYKLGYTQTPIQFADVAIKRWAASSYSVATKTTPGAVASIVRASPDALSHCANLITPTVNINMDFTSVTATDENMVEYSQCWPISFTPYMTAPALYFGDACAKGNATLTFMQWFLTSPTLTTSAASRGLYRLMLTDGYVALYTQWLNSATCDGETMLITLPVQWQLSAAITIFAWAMTALGLICIVISAVILFRYRMRSVLRSSSVPFQFVILVGLAMMYIAAGVFGSYPTDGRCQSLAWLLNIGFTLMFGPLFAKMWRIYKIFDRKVLKVVKISNERLAAFIGALVVKDVILNIIWQFYSPLYAAPIYKLENGRMHSYMQCTGDKGSLPFLILIVCLKMNQLIFGSFMGFTTRNVASTFNESKNVAWAIYNVFFSIAIIVPILFFSNAIGDAFQILLVFLLFWISCGTMIFNFGSKFLMLFKSEEGTAHISNRSNMSAGGGGDSGDMGVGSNQQLFSFPSIMGIHRGIIDKYIAALESQMAKAKLRYKQLLEESGGNEGNQGTRMTKEGDKSLGGVSQGGNSQLGNMKLPPPASTYSRATTPVQNRDSAGLYRVPGEVPSKDVGVPARETVPPIYQPSGHQQLLALARFDNLDASAASSVNNSPRDVINRPYRGSASLNSNQAAANNKEPSSNESQANSSRRTPLIVHLPSEPTSPHAAQIAPPVFHSANTTPTPSQPTSRNGSMIVGPDNPLPQPLPQPSLERTISADHARPVKFSSRAAQGMAALQSSSGSTSPVPVDLASPISATSTSSTHAQNTHGSVEKPALETLEETVGEGNVSAQVSPRNQTRSAFAPVVSSSSSSSVPALDTSKIMNPLPTVAPSRIKLPQVVKSPPSMPDLDEAVQQPILPEWGADLSLADEGGKSEESAGARLSGGPSSISSSKRHSAHSESK